MERYVLVLTDGQTHSGSGSSSLRNCIQRFLPKEKQIQNQPCLTDVKDTHIAHLHTWGKESKSGALRDCTQWMSTAEFLEHGCCLAPDATVNDVETEEEDWSTQKLADQLHELADSLPKFGSWVDVVWLYPEDDKRLLVENNLQLYGALKRLLEWHGALVTIVTDGCVSEDNILGDWVEILKACVSPVTMTTCPDMGGLQWRGCVVIHGGQHVKPTCLSGFSLVAMTTELPALRVTYPDLESNDNSVTQAAEKKLLARQIEFLTEVAIGSVPTHMVTHHCYRLCLHSDSELLLKSQRFLERLYKDRQSCYLVRLDYGSSWRETRDGRQLAAGNQGNSGDPVSDKWRHLVIENLNNATVSPFEKDTELHGELGCHHLLLVADPSDSECDPSRKSCRAYLMKPLSQLNGKLMHELTSASLKGAYPEPSQDEIKRKEVQTFLQTLPCFSGDSVVQLQHNVEMVQAHVLTQWIEDRRGRGEGTQITAPDLRMLLALSRELYIEQLNDFEDFPRHQTPAMCLEIQTPKPEWEADPYSQLERLVLAHCSSEKFERHTSSDSLASLGAPTKGQVVMLDAAEFLKSFNTDGSARKEPLSLVSAKKSGSGKLYKHNSEEVLQAGWPDSNLYNSHGIYYNSKTREEMEQKTTKLRARLQYMETSSTCTLQQANSPATMTVIRETQPKEDEEELENIEVTGRSTRVKRSRDEESHSERKSSRTPRRRGSTARSKDEKTRSHTSAAASKQAKTKLVLSNVVRDTVEANGVPRKDPLYNRCIRKLYELSKTFVRDLSSSRNLKFEMEKIAQSHVKQVIDFERSRRQANR